MAETINFTLLLLSGALLANLRTQLAHEGRGLVGEEGSGGGGVR